MFDRWRLVDLPTPAKVLLTLFLAIIGSGYLMALGNLYYQLRGADGKAALTVDDLRVTFHGMELAATGDRGGSAAVPKSRMMQMVEPGGKMRKHLSDGGAPAIRSLETWLNDGAKQAEFDKAGLVESGDPAPSGVISLYCLECHNRDTGEKDDAPYGPDVFTVDYEMVSVYAAPGTAVEEKRNAEGGGTSAQRRGPQGLGHLFLISHVHMLSIPVFTLIVSGLFLFTGFGARVKGWLGVIPMASLVVDFASWWLARVYEGLIHAMLVAGPVYGASLAVLLFAVLGSMWLGRRSPTA